MNDCNASKQNFDSSYIYKVEEREESEEIVCHSNRGLVSIETNELPKEPQGYIERKLIRNAPRAYDEFDPQNCTSTNVMLQQLNPSTENTKTGPHSTLRSVNTPNRFSKNSKRFHRSHQMNSPLNSASFERRKNHRLDCPSSNSTPSEGTFKSKPGTLKFDPTVKKNNKRQPISEKSFTKLTTKKSQPLFCNDPNKRLKNLFTIIKPNEKISENVNVPIYDVDLLNKTKGFLVKLIDEELQRVHLDEETNVKSVQSHRANGIDRLALKKLKLECISKIEEELRLIKELQI